MPGVRSASVYCLCTQSSQWKHLSERSADSGLCRSPQRRKAVCVLKALSSEYLAAGSCCSFKQQRTSSVHQGSKAVPHQVLPSLELSRPTHAHSGRLQMLHGRHRQDVVFEVRSHMELGFCLSCAQSLGAPQRKAQILPDRWLISSKKA